MSVLSAQTIAEIFSAYEQMDDSLQTEASWQPLTDAHFAQEASGLLHIRALLEAWKQQDNPADEQIEGDILDFLLQDRLDYIQFHQYRLPLNAEGGFLAGVVYRFQAPEDLDSAGLASYKQALRTLPSYFEAQMGQMKSGLKSGYIHPANIVENCLKMIDQVLETAPDSSFFVQRLRKEENQAIIRPLVSEQVYPAYRSLNQFLQEEYLPRARATFGISEVPEGKAYYARRVKYFTTLDMSPGEVFETGQKEVARIQAEMKTIIKEVGFKGSFEEFLTFLRTDSQFYAASPEALLHRAAWITKEMEGELPRFFGALPRIPLTVKPVPSALAPTYTGGRYSPGAVQPPRAGQYWVNTYKLDSRPLYVLPALTLHEGVPGHHLQIMLAAEAQNRSKWRQSAYFSAFGEGWGLYAEFLGEEAGLYHTPYERFGRLTYEMWRACRLVVDPGIHVKGWTRQEAIDFMASHTALSLHEVTTEIDRYIGWPAQAVSYKTGELKIKALRKMAEETLGDKFVLRDFHDAVLAEGSVPLLTLERIVKAWIEEVKATE